MKRILHLTMVLMMVAACAPTETTRGNFLFVEDVQTIKPMETSKNDVLNLLGTPTSTAVFDDKTWYYVGLKTEKESFFDEKVVERQIYKLTFTDDNLVQSVSRVDDEALDVPLASRVTPTSGNEVTFLQQMLGNLGRFNPPAQP